MNVNKNISGRYTIILFNIYTGCRNCGGKIFIASGFFSLRFSSDKEKYCLVVSFSFVFFGMVRHYQEISSDNI